MGEWQISFSDSEPVPPGLVFTPVRLSHIDRGGCDIASLRVDGRLEDLQYCTDYLGRRIVIRNPVGSVVWWGVVVAASVGLGKWGVGRSLAQLCNRALVEYTIEDVDGQGGAAATAWQNDTTSQTLYGTREHRASIGQASAAEAAARLATLLAHSAEPATIRSRTGGLGAGLVCWGLAKFLEWKYYQNLAGRIEHDGDDARAMAIGWERTGSEIGFWETAMHDMGGGLAGLEEGNKIVVSGSVSNDGEKTVAEKARGTTASLTATTISFLSNDDIYDSANGFGVFEASAFVHIAGSSLNNGYHAIDGKPDDGYMTTKQSFTNAIVNESAGASITIRQGNRVGFPGAVVDEKPAQSASVNVRLVGWEMAQSFTATANMTLSRVAVLCGKVGTPADTLHVRLYSNAAGVPGTWLDTATIGPADIPSSVGWVWADWATGLAVTAGTTYFLLVARSGANSWENYYLSGLVSGAYGTTLAWNGATWSAPTWLPEYPVSLAFRVWDAEDTSASIARIIAQCGGGFVASAAISATGVERNQYADNGARAEHEMKRLLDIGTASGGRLTYEVDQQGGATFAVQPERPTDLLPLPIYSDDDRITQYGGAEWQDGASVAGQWVRLALPAGIGAHWDVGVAYAQRSEYDVEKAAWALTFDDEEKLKAYRGT